MVKPSGVFFIELGALDCRMHINGVQPFPRESKFQDKALNKKINFLLSEEPVERVPSGQALSV